MPTVRAAALAAVTLALAAQGRGGELPTWRLAEMNGLVAGQWRPVAQDAGGKYRAAGMVFKPDYDESRPLNINTRIFEDLGVTVKVR